MNRRLQLSLAGFWYIGLTIALGIVALATSNNVFYLIESMLLSAMILSGILSERAISAIRFEVQRLPATALAPSQDRVRVFNKGKRPVFCIQIGEWRKGRFHALAYVPRLNGRSDGYYPSRQIFPIRGNHHWDGWAVATSYPFGFARKLLIQKEAGSRIIWPKRNEAKDPQRISAGAKAALSSGSTIVEGEVRPLTHDDDCRGIVWTLSAKGTDPMVRMRKAENSDPHIQLDLRHQEDDFEETVNAAAQPFHSLSEEGASGMLTLIDDQGRKCFHGRVQALNQLAVVKASAQSKRIA